MTAPAHVERIVAVPDLGEHLATLRLADASALAAVRASLAQYGQLCPVRTFEQDGALEVFDGFKRLRAARGLGLRELRAVVADVSVVEATAHMRELHAGRGLTALEEGWIVRALHREHRLTQGAIATQLRCHKSWVCRRLLLVEALDTSVQADVRLGLLAPRAAVLVAALPRGNQSAACDLVVRRGLTVRQTTTLVRELSEAATPAAQAGVLARWGEGPSPSSRRSGSVPRSLAETIARDITTIRRSAGRLRASLSGVSLTALGPAGDVLRDDLGELGGVLGSLSQTIASSVARAEGA